MNLDHHRDLDDDPDDPGGTPPPQGGEVHFFQAQRILKVRGIKSTNRPWLIANAIVGAVNRSSWQGEGPREWMCTNISWTLLDRWVSPRYWLLYEFQHNEDTWDPTAVFIDSRTGRPATELVAGTGYKTIQFARGVDFEAIVGTRIHSA